MIGSVSVTAHRYLYNPRAALQIAGDCYSLAILCASIMLALECKLASDWAIIIAPAWMTCGLIYCRQIVPRHRHQLMLLVIEPFLWFMFRPMRELVMLLGEYICVWKRSTRHVEKLSLFDSLTMLCFCFQMPHTAQIRAHPLRVGTHPQTGENCQQLSCQSEVHLSAVCFLLMAPAQCLWIIGAVHHFGILANNICEVLSLYQFVCVYVLLFQSRVSLTTE